jgi:hypothetical protein
MPSEKASLIRILKQNGGIMQLWRLDHEMIIQRASGSKVKTEDVIYQLKTAGKVDYDPRNGLVSLK